MYPSILKNTLISDSGIDALLSLPKDDAAQAATLEILMKFQDIRKFASEIHTEIHLVKPVLKILGYSYESKPKFFEDQIKGPDVALFATDDERAGSSKAWGTQEYYGNALGVLVLKRYGRDLFEGISGFYLEFENRIPIYQTIYLLKKTKTPWAILTNGRLWILVKRPVNFEHKLIEVDMEFALSGDPDVLHLFHQIFSLSGLASNLPRMIEGERRDLIELLNRGRASIQRSSQTLKKKAEIYPKLLSAFESFFSGRPFPLTESFLGKTHVGFPSPPSSKEKNANDFNMADMFSYLFVKKGDALPAKLDELLIPDGKVNCTKEDLLSMKILDMTPGLGTATIHLMETLAHMTFVLPYRDKNTFVAEWEEETSLKKHIADNVLYGIERSHVCLDILNNAVKSRFAATLSHFRFGNPLIGMSLRDIDPMADAKDQMGLFGKSPKDVVKEFKEMYHTFFSLSEKIREDKQIRKELEVKLHLYTERIRDVMDLTTATYFTKHLDRKRIQDALFSIDTDERTWGAVRKKEWFAEGKDIARRNGFFHLEIEFPFLLNHAFDLIIARPGLTYLWEDEPPFVEAAKAFIKRGMTYLKDRGKMAIVTDESLDELASALKPSKKYDAQITHGLLILRKKG